MTTNTGTNGVAADAPMDLPVISLGAYLADPASAEGLAQCVAAASALITYGALVVHDPRVPAGANDEFLDLLEDYFAQPQEVLERDTRPELAYQVGATLENTERPKCAVDEDCLDVIARLAESERPLDISGHQPDPKCRFFWRMGETPPYETAFPALNAENVVPSNPKIAERWTTVLERWGNTMKTAVADVAEMAAVGMGLPAMTFKDAGCYGPHLLAPTASDLTRHGALNTILAGFHTDLNFLTIHGRSRYPGLHIWARNTGRRLAVRIPTLADRAPTLTAAASSSPSLSGDGDYLLVQAGKQLEHLTGGLVRAGYHEVVVNSATLAAMERRRREKPDRPLIRISSTFFWHLSSDFDLVPIPELAERARAIDGAAAAAAGGDRGKVPVYEAMKVGEQVQRELKHIALMTS